MRTNTPHGNVVLRQTSGCLFVIGHEAAFIDTSPVWISSSVCLCVAQNCWNCGRKAYETCSGCHRARYCGTFCQHRHWETHHSTCRPVAASAAADRTAHLSNGPSAAAAGNSVRIRKTSSPSSCEPNDGTNSTSSPMHLTSPRGPSPPAGHDAAADLVAARLTADGDSAAESETVGAEPSSSQLA